MARSDHFRTPPEIYNPLNREFNFTLDPCPINGVDGLSQSWEGETVFVNPPYSKIEPWVKKAWYHSKEGEATVVMLLPSRTDQKWFIDYVWPYADIRWIRGHVHFYNADGSKCKWNFREACFIAIFRIPLKGDQ
jgi:site-specific DNA-methyltransferase (adenine-specific)